MRNPQTLNQTTVDPATGVITFTAAGENALQPIAALRHEGEYVPISVSYGALEIALRPRVKDMIRTLRTIQPNDGLNTSRQVGSADCFLGLGLRTDGTLILRPTIVGDASGYFCLNLALSPEAAAAFRAWLGEEAEK